MKAHEIGVVKIYGLVVTYRQPPEFNKYLTETGKDPIFRERGLLVEGNVQVRP